MDPTTETLIELNAKLERLINGIDTLHANQERMSEDISKIKEAVYNPDEGLYARLRALEQWKDSQSKKPCSPAKIQKFETNTSYPASIHTHRVGKVQKFIQSFCGGCKSSTFARYQKRRVFVVATNTH